MNDPVTGVRVQSLRARARHDKVPLGALLDLPRLADPDAVRDGQRLAVGVIKTWAWIWKANRSPRSQGIPLIVE